MTSVSVTGGGGLSAPSRSPSSRGVIRDDTDVTATRGTVCMGDVLRAGLPQMPPSLLSGAPTLAQQVCSWLRPRSLECHRGWCGHQNTQTKGFVFADLRLNQEVEK